MTTFAFFRGVFISFVYCSSLPQSTSVSLASSASSTSSPSLSDAIEWCVCEVFGDIYLQIPLTLPSSKRICFSTKKVAFVPFSVLSIAISQLTSFLGCSPMQTSGRMWRSQTLLPIVPLRRGFDSSFRFRFRLFGFQLLHRCFLLSSPPFCHSTVSILRRSGLSISPFLLTN